MRGRLDYVAWERETAVRTCAAGGRERRSLPRSLRSFRPSPAEPAEDGTVAAEVEPRVAFRSYRQYTQSGRDVTRCPRC